MARVRVEGAANLRRTLKKSGVDLKQLRSANREAARSILPIATAMAPVGPPVPAHWSRQHAPGQLKKSMRVAATNRAGMVRSGRKSIPYAGPIHWGWAARNIKAQPWISQAVTQNEAVWMGVYMDHIDDVLDQIRGK